MKKFNYLLLAGLLGLTATVKAATIASPLVWGGSTQNSAKCYLYNASASVVTLGARQIKGHDGSVLPSSGNCTSTLLPGGVCELSATPVVTTAYLCRFVVSSAAAIRGSFELRGNTIIQRADLR